MYLSIVELLAIKAGAKAIKSTRTGKPLFAVVAAATSDIYVEVQQLMPELVFTSLSAAVTALADGSATSNIAPTIYVANGTYTSTAKQVVPAEQSGIRIYFDKGSLLTTATALSAGDGLLEIEAVNAQLVGFPRLSNSNASQTGSALIVGGSAAGEGAGTGVYIENLVIEGGTAATDWVKPFVLRGAADAIVKDSVINGSTATTRIISIESGNSRDSTNVVLENVTAKATTDSGNTCIPIYIAASQTGGFINGGQYVTDGSGVAADINANNWTLDDGVLFSSTAAVGNKAHVKLTTATIINIGRAYVKDNNAATAATLLDQTNV